MDRALIETGREEETMKLSHGTPPRKSHSRNLTIKNLTLKTYQARLRLRMRHTHDTELAIRSKPWPCTPEWGSKPNLAKPICIVMSTRVATQAHEWVQTYIPICIRRLVRICVMLRDSRIDFGLLYKMLIKSVFESKVWPAIVTSRVLVKVQRTCTAWSRL